MPEMIIIEPTVNAAERVLRVAAYCRVSSDSDDQLNSYANQVGYYTKLISDNKNWELVDIYADEGLTGTRADTRPEFQRLLKDCRKGKIDKVLTKAISRTFRNMKDCLTSIRELKSLGVEVFFEKEQLDTGSITSEMLLSFFGALAQDESVSISGNMRWSYQRRMQSGEFITCYAPYGYRLAGRDLIVDEKEAQIVRRIFAEYLSGTSVNAIAAALASEGAPKRNDYWLAETVKFILRNEKYVGNVLLQKSYTTDIFPFKRARNYGERDMYYIENSHTPIISLETFEQANRLRQSRLICRNQPPQQQSFKRKIV